MKKLMIGAILSVAFTCGIFVYTEWDKRRFINSLPKPPTVEQPVDTPPKPQAPPQDAPIPATPSNTVVFESETVAEENTATFQMSEDVYEGDTLHIDTEGHLEAVSQRDAAGQTDAEHQHPSTRSPFAKKITRIEDMDPDELADMTLASLLRQFGDIPEVHTFTALKRKKLKKHPLTLDEHIEYTAAQYYLWPDPRTQKTLEIFLEKRATEHQNREVNP